MQGNSWKEKGTPRYDCRERSESCGHCFLRLAGFACLLFVIACLVALAYNPGAGLLIENTLNTKVLSWYYWFVYNTPLFHYKRKKQLESNRWTDMVDGRYVGAKRSRRHSVTGAVKPAGAAAPSNDAAASSSPRAGRARGESVTMNPLMAGPTAAAEPAASARPASASRKKLKRVVKAVDAARQLEEGGRPKSMRLKKKKKKKAGRRAASSSMGELDAESQRYIDAAIAASSRGRSGTSGDVVVVMMEE
eukprot:PLAT14824.1.p1 GENE.PLAT14824.1~~PLAT14824.1.p1  ORF type:complete len:249 (+),score=80.83 PLAT14824.1:709-1455(+)